MLEIKEVSGERANQVEDFLKDYAPIEKSEGSVVSGTSPMEKRVQEILDGVRRAFGEKKVKTKAYGAFGPSDDTWQERSDEDIIEQLKQKDTFIMLTDDENMVFCLNYVKAGEKEYIQLIDPYEAQWQREKEEKWFKDRGLKEPQRLEDMSIFQRIYLAIVEFFTGHPAEREQRRQAYSNFYYGLQKSTNAHSLASSAGKGLKMQWSEKKLLDKKDEGIKNENEIENEDVVKDVVDNTMDEMLKAVYKKQKEQKEAEKEKEKKQREEQREAEKQKRREQDPLSLIDLTAFNGGDAPKQKDPEEVLKSKIRGIETKLRKEQESIETAQKQLSDVKDGSEKLEKSEKLLEGRINNRNTRLDGIPKKIEENKTKMNDLRQKMEQERKALQDKKVQLENDEAALKDANVKFEKLEQDKGLEGEHGFYWKLEPEEYLEILIKKEESKLELKKNEINEKIKDNESKINIYKNAIKELKKGKASFFGGIKDQDTKDGLEKVEKEKSALEEENKRLKGESNNLDKDFKEYKKKHKSTKEKLEEIRSLQKQGKEEYAEFESRYGLAETAKNEANKVVNQTRQEYIKAEEDFNKKWEKNTELEALDAENKRLLEEMKELKQGNKKDEDELNTIKKNIKENNKVTKLATKFIDKMSKNQQTLRQELGEYKGQLGGLDKQNNSLNK